LDALRAENERLSNLLAQANTRPSAADKQMRELARLRNEVGRLRDQTNNMGNELAKARDLNIVPGGTDVGKRIFHNITMAAFAKFIGGVLQAPVADQTRLTGTYDIEMTPPRLGGVDGRVQRVTGILLNELGLQLIPFPGPFTESQQESDASAGGYAIKLDPSHASGLKPATGEPDSTAQVLAAGQNDGGAQDPNQLAADSSPVSKMNACINNLRLIDAAKQQWALEYRKQATDTPTPDDIRPYLGRGAKGELPVCPDGGVYTFSTVGEKPTCNIQGHVLP
jgi:hypothetical protein